MSQRPRSTAPENGRGWPAGTRGGCGKGQRAQGCGWWRVLGWWLAGCGHGQGLAEGHQEPCREPCGARVWREANGSRAEPGRGEARGNESPGGATGCISRGRSPPSVCLASPRNLCSQNLCLCFLLVSSPSVHPCVHRVRPRPVPSSVPPPAAPSVVRRPAARRVAVAIACRSVEPWDPTACALTMRARLRSHSTMTCYDDALRQRSTMLYDRPIDSA